ELDLVTGFDLLENRRVLDSKHHRVSFIHPEFLDRSMAERNFLCRPIDLGDLPIDHLRLGKCRLRRPGKRESENTGCDQGRLTHASSFPTNSAVYDAADARTCLRFIAVSCSVFVIALAVDWPDGLGSGRGCVAIAGARWRRRRPLHLVSDGSGGVLVG